MARMIEKSEMEGLIAEGMRRRELAKHYGVSHSTIVKYLKLAGIDAKQRAGRKPCIELR